MKTTKSKLRLPKKGEIWRWRKYGEKFLVLDPKDTFEFGYELQSDCLMEDGSIEVWYFPEENFEFVRGF